MPRDLNGNHIADGWKSDFYPYRYDTVPDLERGIVNTSAVYSASYVRNFPWEVPTGEDRQDTVDADTGPEDTDGDLDNTENGDGLTVFEEYRGMVTSTYGHERFDPERKDVYYVLYPGE